VHSYLVCSEIDGCDWQGLYEATDWAADPDGSCDGTIPTNVRWVEGIHNEYWDIGYPTEGCMEDHVDVLSMSIGAPGSPDDALSMAFHNLVELGVIVAVSAGNSGPVGDEQAGNLMDCYDNPGCNSCQLNWYGHNPRSGRQEVCYGEQQPDGVWWACEDNPNCDSYGWPSDPYGWLDGHGHRYAIGTPAAAEGVIAVAANYKPSYTGGSSFQTGGSTSTTDLDKDNAAMYIGTDPDIPEYVIPTDFSNELSCEVHYSDYSNFASIRDEVNENGFCYGDATEINNMFNTTQGLDFSFKMDSDLMMDHVMVIEAAATW
jgi:hypothetical protein